MASLVDSEASFRHRVQELLGSTEYDAFKREGLASYASLAFAVCDQPDRVSETLFDAMCVKVFTTPTLGQRSAVRRLVFEGMTFVLNELKHRMDAGDLPPRALPLQEREERRQRQVDRLCGLIIEGELEPSHGLVDRAAQMLHDGTVSYLAPSTCVSRDDEVAHHKKDKDFLVVESNGVRVQRRDTDILVDVHTEAKLQQALTRRGLALDRVNVVSFAVHDRIMRYFFHLSAQVVPPGFVSPGLAGVIRADKELWLQVARECRTGCKADARGVLPVEVAMHSLHTSALVTFHLMPLQAGRGGAPSGSGTPPPPPPRRPNGKRQRQDTPDRPPVANTPPPKGRGRGKGSGKSQTKTKTKPNTNMPSGLREFASEDKQGLRICYAYNLAQGCQRQASGSPPQCDKGAHKCIKCHGMGHGLQSCPKKA